MSDSRKGSQLITWPSLPFTSNRKREVRFPPTTGVFSFFEFFAGGGMARAGLGKNWNCAFANDFDFKKSETYEKNWGKGQITTKDVRQLGPEDLPGTPDLVWASFPCQDLSLAGMGAGLRGDRSGTFWPFWSLVKSLSDESRGPKILVLENVCGTLTSHQGKDFAAIAQALADAKYNFGALVVDAAHFVPQSRPRLFILGVSSEIELPARLSASGPSGGWHPRALQTAHSKLAAPLKQKWIWWRLPAPPSREVKLLDLIEESPTGVQWHSAEETARLIGMMSAINREKLEVVKRLKGCDVGAVYKRTRYDEEGRKVQRAEVRFDGLAGCLRTSSGGSSRQFILIVRGGKVRSRLLSNREAARLMGLPDSYELPPNYNEAYHLTGDGIVVPVVRHLAKNLFEPILREAKRGEAGGRNSLPTKSSTQASDRRIRRGIEN